MAAYNRRNRCHLHLKIQALSEIGEPAEIIDEIIIDCLEVVDNNYFTVHLDKALPTGQYRCELHAPDSDVENAVALFVGIPSQPIEFNEESDTPKPLSLPAPEQYRQWHLHHVCREETLAAQRDEIARLTSPPLLSIVLTQIPNEADWKRLQDSLIEQTYPYWECLLPESSVIIDDRFKPFDEAQSMHNEWSILLEPGIIALEPQALYVVVQTIFNNIDIPPDFIYADGLVVDADDNIARIDFYPDFNPWWYAGYPYVGRFLVCRGFSRQTIEMLLLDAIASDKTVLHIPQTLHRSHPPTVDRCCQPTCRCQCLPTTTFQVGRRRTCTAC